jgi:hypothetical protein
MKLREVIESLDSPKDYASLSQSVRMVFLFSFSE